MIVPGLFLSRQWFIHFNVGFKYDLLAITNFFNNLLFKTCMKVSNSFISFEFIYYFKTYKPSTKCWMTTGLRSDDRRTDSWQRRNLRANFLKKENLI